MPHTPPPQSTLVGKVTRVTVDLVLFRCSIRDWFYLLGPWLFDLSLRAIFCTLSSVGLIPSSGKFPLVPRSKLLFVALLHVSLCVELTECATPLSSRFAGDFTEWPANGCITQLILYPGWLEVDFWVRLSLFSLTDKLILTPVFCNGVNSRVLLRFSIFISDWLIWVREEDYIVKNSVCVKGMHMLHRSSGLSSAARGRY